MKLASTKASQRTSYSSLIANKKLRTAVRNWQLYLMILPALAYIIIFAYKPMYGVQIAFREYNFADGITGSKWVGFDQFKRLFNSYWFPITLKNTLTLSFLSIIIGFPLPIIFSLMLNELKNDRVKKTIQTVSYAPHFISTVVMCGMLLLFLSPTSGVINVFIKKFGGDSIAFMNKPQMFKWVYVLSDVWQGLGWGSIIYCAALSGVDKELLEAAEIDGASRFKRIWYINIPVLIPTIVVQLILRCGSLLSVGYEKTLLLQNNVNLNASEVISTYVYKVGLEQFNYSFSTAAGLFNSLCNTIMLITVNKITKKVSGESLW